MADDNKTTAAENWARYDYGVSRGHREYTETAKLLEGMYLGGGYDGNGRLKGGGQWTQADLDILNEERRPAYEFNEIKPALDAAFGYQISNRMDISFRPRSGDATKEAAEVRSKVAMQIADNNKLPWLETDLFSDGLIQQRGYYDIRMSFDDSVDGEVKIRTIDPLDGMPDPDARSYDPNEWGDWIETRLLSLDDIEQDYGMAARRIAETEALGTADETRWGDDGDGELRNTFGTEDRFDSSFVVAKVKKLRVIDRQHWIRKVSDVAIHPGGDIRPLSGDETPEQRAEMLSKGVLITKRRIKRVRWTVTTIDAVLHDDWSPYDRLTVVPFFPYFRRGKSRGMVDNAVGPQLALNKSASQTVHIINTTANSGWQLEEGQLTNMSTTDLGAWGAKTGLVIERKKGTEPLEKINANPMPQGMAELVTLSSKILQDVTIPDAMRGVANFEESGVAAQSRQHASQQILAVPLDNLARTRHMLAGWINYAISKYYTAERVFKITKQNPFTGKEEQEDLVINEFDPGTGQYLNDMTAGEYDVVVAEQPMQITFDNSQFEQISSMRKDMGVAIPDAVVIKHSNLSDKHEIITAMEGAGQPQQPVDPTLEAKARLIDAQIRKTDAEAINKTIEGMFSGSETAQNIAMTPQLAPVMDQILKSSGWVDKDGPPLVDNSAIQPIPENPGPENTNPLTPTNPSVGMNAGIEGGDIV